MCSNREEYFSSSWYTLLNLFHKNGNKQPAGDNMETIRRWDELPKDIMEIIILRLSLSDRIRMRIVCKSWRALVMQKDMRVASPELPWLLLSHCPDYKHLTFFNMSENRVHHLKLPNSVQGGWCGGSSKGWLVFAKQTTFRNQIFLYNPVSGAQQKLPSLKTIPSFRDFVHFTSKPYEVFYFIDQIVLSSADTSECMVAAIMNSNKLALCRPDDKKWSVIKIKGDGDIMYRDILFSNEKLYALVLSKSKKAIAATHISNVACPEVILELIPDFFEGEVEYPLALQYELDFVIRPKAFFFSYLVETTNNELLVIHKMVDRYKRRQDEDIEEEDEEIAEGDNEDEEGGIDENVEVVEDEEGQEEKSFVGFDYVKVSEFRVYKVDPKDTTQVCRINNLGEQVLFLVRQGSLSLPTSDFNGFLGNSIYFADDIDYSVSMRHDNYPLVSRETGVYYLDDGRIERSFPSSDLQIPPQLVWYTPKEW